MTMKTTGLSHAVVIATNARSGVTSRAMSAAGASLALAPYGSWADVAGVVSYVSCAAGGPVL